MNSSKKTTSGLTAAAIIIDGSKNFKIDRAQPALQPARIIFAAARS
jgi:hypothetical protein